MFFCLLGGLTYFLIWSSFFWVENIEVESLTLDISENLRSEVIEIAQSNLAEKFWRIIPQKSIFLTQNNKIEEDVLAQFPEIREVVVYKEMPNIFALRLGSSAGLRIVVEERENIGVWCQVQQMESEFDISTTTLQSDVVEDNEIATSSPETSPRNNIREISKCFYIDREGIIYRESPLMSGSLILNIYSAKNQSADIRAQVVSPELIDYILQIREILPKIKTVKGLSLKAVDFEIISMEDLKVTTFGGWQIYFNPAYSVDSHLNTLQLVLEEQIKEDYSSLEYIDLRIKGRVYYR